MASPPEKQPEEAKPSVGSDSESLSKRPQELKRYVFSARRPTECLTDVGDERQANETTVRPTIPTLVVRRDGQAIYRFANSHIAMISIGGPSFNSTRVRL